MITDTELTVLVINARVRVLEAKTEIQRELEQLNHDALRELQQLRAALPNKVVCPVCHKPV